jgi:RNA polymerase-binding transcription factor DksA
MLAHDLDLDDVRRHLRARRLAIMVRYQVEAVFRAAAEGELTARQDAAWMRLLSDEDAVRLLRIFEALRRIELGTYGRCAGCGEPIDGDRLVAEPETHHCQVCAAFAACVTTDLAHAH